VDHKKLDLWQKSIKSAGMVFTFTQSLPEVFRFNLADQMNRASVSIASNVAEGAARGSAKDFIGFLNITAGSASELHTHLAILEQTHPLNKKETQEIQKFLVDVSKMIQGLIKSLKRKLDQKLQSNHKLALSL